MATGAAALVHAAVLCACGPGDPASFVVPDGARRPPLSDEEAAAVGRRLAERLSGTMDGEGALPAALGAVPGAAYLAARDEGALLADAWGSGPGTGEALERALAALLEALGDRRADVTELEVELAHSFERVDPAVDPAPLSDIHRGLRGVEFTLGDERRYVAPGEMLARNVDFEDAFERYAEERGLTRGAADERIAIRVFAADMLFVDLAVEPVRTVRMYRGNELVRIDEVTRENVERLRDALAGWLFANLGTDGRMAYEIHPGLGLASPENNMIRQWMATTAMGRVARAHDDPALAERVATNIRHNLSQFYMEEDGLGLIDEWGKVKLGAIALAALAIVEHPRRAEWTREEQALLRTVDELWTASGRFRTFYRPADRDDNENFYPGEALLLWATLYDGTRDAALLERFMRSMRWYREWHLDHRNPAFVPWHTQAYYTVWRTTADPELAGWVFEMNDWLVTIQQWNDVADFPDTMGRFYAPDRPFGPPHASATGVYVEGLIDAWQMATELGDATRAERYRRAIMRALRSVMQLTFFDDVDMFYVAHRDVVRGGVRSTVYDHRIRVDNVQHNLMGILRILERMPPEAFRP